MKLRTKTVIFFGIFLFAIALAVIFYAEYVVGVAFQNQVAKSLRIDTEGTEGAYFAFLESLKMLALNWSSDPTIKSIAEELIATENGTPARDRVAKDFTEYLTEKKMPYNKSVFMVDILDKKGIVIASTRPKRIGTDELAEEIRINAHHFSKSIVSNFGEVFIKSIIFEKDETLEPMIHATVRFFKKNPDGTEKPLDAVLLVHFLEAEEISTVLVGESQVQNGAPIGKGFSASYRTSEVYMVNSEKYMVTPSRYVPDIKKEQRVDTLPVRECLEKGNEVDAEYTNYRGVRVLGSSACLADEGLVMVLEVNKDEILAPKATMVNTAIVGGGIVLVFGILIIAIFVRKPLKRVDAVVVVAGRVAKGDLDAQVSVQTNDEIGYLASSFNKMISTIRNNQKELQASKQEVEAKARILEEDLKEHEKQQEFLAQSKRATLNLLEDSWNAGERLQAESNKLQTIISSIGDGLILIDGGYKIVLVNPRMLEMFAMSRQDVVGKDLREVMKLWKKKKDEVLPAQWPIEEMFLTKSIVTTTLEDELSLTTAQREKQIPVVLSVSPLGSSIPGGVIVIRDVTADRELDDAKSGFISVASHQLRTPLTSIRWYSEMLLSNDVGTLNEAQKDFMIEVHDGAERLYRTVDLLLGISRIESGKIKAEKVSIDLGAFTGEIVKELSSQIDEKKIVLSVFPPEGDPAVVVLDSLTLRQVILNLLSNAIRYTNEDNGIIEVRWVNEGGKEVKYSVRDNGIGIPEAQRGRIFQKFFRAENALAHVPDGSGLGLALVKELVESWGGKVWFETEERNGTTFFFTVPLV